MPEERISWKESNLALIGSDLDKKIKQAAAEGEDNWKTVGVAPGVKVWRIEKFKVVEWPEEKYGKFYTGDSYIVLNSWTHPGKDKLHHDLYIWIGAESSQDEYGTAAYKMVEADDYTGGIAVQHREVQGHESYKFKVLFEGSTLTYWEGGVDTGFHHVEPTEEKPNLYKVKGTEKAMSLTQVKLEKGSLNNGDSFILMASTDKVWCWNGESANPDEKARAISFAEMLCSKGTVTVLEQGDDADDTFWAYLGEGEIADADQDDHAVEEFAPLLFKIPGDGGDAELVGKGEKVKTGFQSSSKVSKDLLNDSDVFLLDAGWEVYLWIGSNAHKSEKLAAFSKADKYCAKHLRTMHLPLSFVKSGMESADFESYFA